MKKIILFLLLQCSCVLPFNVKTESIKTSNYNISNKTFDVVDLDSLLDDKELAIIKSKLENNGLKVAASGVKVDILLALKLQTGSSYTSYSSSPSYGIAYTGTTGTVVGLGEGLASYSLRPSNPTIVQTGTNINAFNFTTSSLYVQAIDLSKVNNLKSQEELEDATIFKANFSNGRGAKRSLSAYVDALIKELKSNSMKSNHKETYWKFVL